LTGRLCVEQTIEAPISQWKLTPKRTCSDHLQTNECSVLIHFADIHFLQTNLDCSKRVASGFRKIMKYFFEPFSIIKWLFNFQIDSVFSIFSLFHVTDSNPVIEFLFTSNHFGFFDAVYYFPNQIISLSVSVFQSVVL